DAGPRVSGDVVLRALALRPRAPARGQGPHLRRGDAHPTAHGAGAGRAPRPASGRRPAPPACQPRRAHGRRDLRAIQGRRRGRRAQHPSPGPHAAAALRARQAWRRRPGPRGLHLSRRPRRRPRQAAPALLQRALQRARAVGRRGIAARRELHRPLRALSRAGMTERPLRDTPGMPRDQEGPVFREPWEAQAFGMAVMLHERGHFTWMEWTKRLATEIAAARARGEHDDGTRYYHYWLAAPEKLVAEKHLGATDGLATRKHEWDVAARSTPHGQPITLPGRRARSGATTSEVLLPGLPVVA